LLPLDKTSEMSHIKICIPQITISPPQKQSIAPREESSSFSSSSIFGKEMIFQSASVEFHRLPAPALTAFPTDHQFYHSIVTSPFRSLIINPFHTNLHLTIHEEESEYSSFLLTSLPTKAYYRSEMIIKVSNLDISPNLSQLSLLQETIFDFRNSSRKYRSQLLRPMERPSRSRHNNISSWWRYALVGTMIERNGDSSFFPRNNFNIGFISEISKEQRSRYIDLYSQVLRQQPRLSERGGTPEGKAVPCLTEEELRSLEEMHSRIDWGSLLIFRLVAHKKIFSTQSSSTTTSSSSLLRTSTVGWSSLLSVFTSPQSYQETNPSSSTQQPMIDFETEFKIFSRDIRQSLQELSSFNTFPIDFTIVFSRFALSLDSNDRLTRSVTVIFYGFLCNFHQNFLSCDGLAHLRLGALRVFGKDGIPLISCGEYTDEWFHSYDIQSSTTRTLALSFQYQWFTQNKRSVLYTFPSESNTAKPTISYNPHSSKLTHGIKQHGILEVSCNILRIFCDSDSFQHLWKLSSTLREAYSSSLSRGFDLNPNKMPKGDPTAATPVTASDLIRKKNLTKATQIKCAQVERKNLLSTRHPSSSVDSCVPVMKWSISATLAGLILQFPLKSQQLRASERARQRSNDSSSSSMIQLSIGFCSLYSGDFLMSLDVFKSMSGSSSILFPATRNQADSSIQDSSQSLPELKENRYCAGMLHGVWANRDKILQYKIRKQIGGALLQHCVCTIHSFEINGHFPHHQSSYTEAPINFQLLFTWSSGLSPQVPVLAIDLLSSSVHVSLKNQVPSLPCLSLPQPLSSAL
jgi:hypothetical protein